MSVPKQTSPAMSLPARYYTDEAYYRAELEWLFLDMWFHAGRAEDIANPGQFVVREIAGESLIVLRDDRGELRAFHNVCRHRGTRLVSECSGRFARPFNAPTTPGPSTWVAVSSRRRRWTAWTGFDSRITR